MKKKRIFALVIEKITAMSDETILDKNEGVKTPRTGNAENKQTAKESPAKAKNEGKNKTFGAAFLAGLVGLAGGILTPLEVFPQNSESGIAGLAGLGDGLFSKKTEEDSEEIDLEETPEQENPDQDPALSATQAPAASERLFGHEMDIAFNINDDMTFSQAFAAARHEVGAGGLFVWHGHTYGTYYADEWGAMTPEDKEQYWADVHHTTHHINHVVEEHLSQDVPLDSEAGTLYLGDNDILDVIDTDGDGVLDAAVVDANGNDIPDLLLDTDGDGNLDTLATDVELQVNAGEVHEINDIAIVTTEKINPLDDAIAEPDALETSEETATIEEPEIIEETAAIEEPEIIEETVDAEEAEVPEDDVVMEDLEIAEESPDFKAMTPDPEPDFFDKQNLSDENPAIEFFTDNPLDSDIPVDNGSDIGEIV